MSLILEALRKSEERRRLGETPSLISESAWATRRRYQARASRRGLHLLAMALLAAVIAAAAWWWWWRETAPVPPAPAQANASASIPAPAERAAVATEGPAPVAAALPPGIAAPAPNPGYAAAPTPSAPPPAVTAQPLPTAPVDLGPTRAPIDPAVQARFERGEVFANSVDQLRTVQPTQEAPYVPPDAALPQPLPDPENPPELAALPPPASAPRAVVAEPVVDTPGDTVLSTTPTPELAQAELTATTQADTNDDDASAEMLPLHWQLSAEARARMPALKLSMHVYAADPAGRFVILDGKRRVEGDPIDQGLRVEAIRRDGVVLSYNGQRFLVARAGQ